MTETTKRRGRPPSGGREEILRATHELLRERGMAKLTTREVAERAGVSEGSVFYHFEDRFGLLRAVFERSLDPLQLPDTDPPYDDLRGTLSRMSAAIEGFLTNSLDVMMAAQSDAGLRDSLHAYMLEKDYGPHRGIASIGAYLAAKQELGLIRADVSPTVLATMVVTDAFQRASLPKLIGNSKAIQPRADFIDTLLAMISPAG
ncbi:MAG: regulatory protein TetR [Marmoricola sp.]|nr:regulatory protein TetR [Marmoricola sp.]